MALQAFFSKLGSQPEENTRILMFRNEEDGKTPLDIALDSNQVSSTSILIEMIQKYHNNPVFNYLIESRLCDLIEINLDITGYLSSPMCLYKIL